MSEPNSEFQATPRTVFHRRPLRGTYKKDVLAAILDEGLIAHVAAATEAGPMLLPMAYARWRDSIVLHGSTANRLLRALRDGAEACVAVTLVDGVVLARSAFHHSMNYRCAIVYGHATEIIDTDDKREALLAVVEHVTPGRSSEARPPAEEEMLQTIVLAIPLAEAAAKVRTGPPIDEEEDYELSVWAGFVPLSLVAGTPVADPRLPAGVPVPDSAVHYARPGTGT